MRKITFTDIYRLRTVKKNSMLYLGDPEDGGAVFMAVDMDMTASKKMTYVIDMAGLLYDRENYTKMDRNSTSSFSMSKAEILAVMENYSICAKETILYEALLDGMTEPIDFEIFLGRLKLLDNALSERTKAFWDVCREVDKRVYIHNKRNIILTELGGVSSRLGELMLLKALSATPGDVDVYIIGLDRLRSGVFDVLLEMRRNGTAIHCFTYKLDICTERQITEILEAFPELIFYNICGHNELSAFKKHNAVYIRNGKLWEITGQDEMEERNPQNGVNTGSRFFSDVFWFHEKDEKAASIWPFKQNIKKNGSRVYEDIKKD